MRRPLRIGGKHMPCSLAEARRAASRVARGKIQSVLSIRFSGVSRRDYSIPANCKDTFADTARLSGRSSFERITRDPRAWG